MQVEWEKSSIQEIDVTATDLSTDCLIDMLTRIPSLKFLSAGQINGFNDSVRIWSYMMERGERKRREKKIRKKKKFQNIKISENK